MIKQLEKFLPSASEIEEMSFDEFECWISRAMDEIPKRKIKRDPLFHLKKRISEILSTEYESEALKEYDVHDVICEYKRKYLR